MVVVAGIVVERVGDDGDDDDLFGVVLHRVFRVLWLVSWFCIGDFETRF